jgi:hypothetical protein
LFSRDCKIRIIEAITNPDLIVRIETLIESVPILLGAFKNAPQIPEAELEIGGGLRLGCCLTIALTPNPHIQLNITGHFWFHFQQIPQGALDIAKHEILRHINSASIVGRQIE